MGGIVEVATNECQLIPGFLDAPLGSQVFHKLHREVNWKQQSIKVFNRTTKPPRLTAWYGDVGAVYRYSGTTQVPLPWNNTLLGLKAVVEIYLDFEFNSVLLNYYRNGDDSMGRHSDDEKELGPDPLIASLSLGETRKFTLHPRPPNPASPRPVLLSHGSLLIMRGSCQKNWKHSVPKTHKKVGPRINLTFRQIIREVN